MSVLLRPLAVELGFVDVLEVCEAGGPLAHSAGHPRDVVGHGLTHYLVVYVINSIQKDFNSQLQKAQKICFDF